MQLPAEVSAGHNDHQEGARLVSASQEDDGDGVAADRLLQLLGQAGEVTRAQRGEETKHEQSERRSRRRTS